MEKLDKVKNAADDYTPENVQGVSIFSAILMIIRKDNFKVGASWKLLDKSGDIKEAAEEYAKDRFQDQDIPARKWFIEDFKAGAKWVVDNIKD